MRLFYEQWDFLDSNSSVATDESTADQFVIKDYSKPMGVATYTTAADMPENLRNALPKTEDLLQLLHNTHES